MDHYMDEKTYLETRRNEALWSLAFWSNPTWTDVETSPLSKAASNLWVVYQRTSIALDKTTVAQVFGDVRGVIPDSRLVKYGDYYYNIDFEDMYYTAEVVSDVCQVFKLNKTIDVQCHNIHLVDLKQNKMNGSDENCTDKSAPEQNLRSVEHCLEMLKQVLQSVKRLAQEYLLLDYWTDTILKLCLRFLCVASVNKKLIELLDCETPFITDFNQLCQSPVEKVEQFSFAQPENEADSNLDSEMLDKLWLKVTSTQVRNCWKDIKVSSQCNDTRNKDRPKTSLLADFNLLRRNKPKNSSKIEQNIDIPKEMEMDLLGSLLRVIDESVDSTNWESHFVDSGILHNFPEAHGKWTKSYFVDSGIINNFPEAHGEWTKSLFPHRLETRSSCENDFTVHGTSNSSSKTTTSDLVRKTEQYASENRTMPYKFYMNFPTPVAAPAMHMPLRPPSVRCPPRNGMFRMQVNNGTPNNMVQQMNFSVSTTQTTRIRMPYFVPPTTTPVRWNPNVPQGARNPLSIQGVPRHCYPRIGLPRMAYHQCISKNLLTNQVRSMKTEEFHFDSETVLQQNDVVPTLKEDKFKRGNMFGDSHWLTSNPNAQQSHEVQPLIKTQESPPNISANCNVPHHIVYETAIRQVAANMHSLQQMANVSFQQYKSDIPMKISYPVAGSRLPVPRIQSTIPLKNNLMLTQPNFRPRFLGNLVINNVRRMHETLLSQNYNNMERQGLSYQGVGRNAVVEKLPICNQYVKQDYEDKVEKWLTAVHKYSKLDPYACLEEELIKSPYLKIPYNHYKLDAKKKKDCLFTEQCNSKKTLQGAYSSVSNEMKNIFNIFGINKKCFRNKGRAFAKYKKKKIKNILLKHLQIFPYYIFKLKKCQDLDRGIALIKSCFVEINSKENNKHYVTSANKALNMKKCSSGRKGDVSMKQKTRSQNKIKLNNQSFPAISGFDMEKCNLLINDPFDYKVLIRESCQFNSFPSKRMKTSNSMALLLDRTWIQDEKTRKVSILRRYAALIDEIFFSNNLSERFDDNQNYQEKTKNEEVVNCWGHFQFALITVLENVINSLDSTASATK